MVRSRFDHTPLLRYTISMLNRDYAYYRETFRNERLPLAFVDLDLLDVNAKSLSERSGSLPMRLATKSLRCVWIIRYLLDNFSSFSGVMAFSPGEAAFLIEQGFDDVLLGYPTMETREIELCLRALHAGRSICFMVDHIDHIQLLEAMAAAVGVVAPVCLDIDLSTSFPGLHFGVFRSPITNFRDAEPLLMTMRSLPHVRLDGVMGYEAQLAGVADALPGSPVQNILLRILKWVAKKESFPRRQGLVRALQKLGYQLRFVNGGGTGSIESTSQDSSVTELTVGSGLYAPALFDHYSNFKHLPAAGFALPVVREARPGIYACAGGGYIASGPTASDKQPSPYLPSGIKLIKLLGAGEVQTSISSEVKLKIGEPVFFRHAKAGELCERFNSLFLVRSGRIEAVVPTYRGQGQCFF